MCELLLPHEIKKGVFNAVALEGVIEPRPTHAAKLLDSPSTFSSLAGSNLGRVLMRRITIAVLLALLATVQARANICADLNGSAIVANDGTFLGTIEDAYAQNSVLNDYGRYGGEFSATSIWNEFGRYGGEFSSLSPFNEFTTSPPVIILRGRAIAYLTRNRSLNGLDPYFLKTCK